MASVARRRAWSSYGVQILYGYRVSHLCAPCNYRFLRRNGFAPAPRLVSIAHDWSRSRPKVGGRADAETSEREWQGRWKATWEREPKNPRKRQGQAVIANPIRRRVAAGLDRWCARICVRLSGLASPGSNLLSSQHLRESPNEEKNVATCISQTDAGPKRGWVLCQTGDIVACGFTRRVGASWRH